jgi:hypothetical protein
MKIGSQQLNDRYPKTPITQIFGDECIHILNSRVPPLTFDIKHDFHTTRTTRSQSTELYFPERATMRKYIEIPTKGIGNIDVAKSMQNGSEMTM